MNFPVFSLSGNRLVSQKGKVSYFYELTPPDLDQKEEHDVNYFLSEIKRCLSRYDSFDFFKLYFLNGKIYLNSTNPEFELPETIVNEYLLSSTHIKRQFKSNLLIKDDYFNLGSKYYRLVSLKDAPESLFGLDFLNIGNFVVSFQKIDKQVAISNLKLKRRLHNSMTFQSIKNIDSVNAYEESEGLLEDVINGEECFFKMELFFIPDGDSLNDLNDSTFDLFAQLKDLDCVGNIENGGLTYFLANLFPGVEPSFKRCHQTQGSYLVNTFNLTRDFVMDDGISFKSTNGNVCEFDLFSNTAHNFNALITGASGQGKSMLGNKIVRESILENKSVVILDLGGSFVKTAKYHNGTELKDSFNPLSFRDPYYLKEFVKSVISEPMSAKEEGRLFEIIKEYNFEGKQFNNFLIYLEHHFQGIRYYFSEILDYFTDDSFQENELTYVNLSNYPEKIKSPLIIYLIEYFKNLKGKKIFLFDECWHLLEKNANYLAECFRTFRKYEASAIAISQNIDDFILNPLGRVIVQNTFFKFYFRQQIKDSEFVNELTKHKISNLYSIKDQYSEFLIEYEGVSKILKFFADQIEFEMFTSSKEDLDQFETYYREQGHYVGFKRALDNFIYLKYPQIGAEHV